MAGSAAVADKNNICSVSGSFNARKEGYGRSAGFNTNIKTAAVCKLLAFLIKIICFVVYNKVGSVFLCKLKAAFKKVCNCNSCAHCLCFNKSKKTNRTCPHNKKIIALFNLRS